MPIPAWHQLQLRIGGARPSAGLILLDLLIHRGNCAGIDLYGFDRKALKTFYHTDERHQRVSAKRRWHDWPLERELVLRWAAENATIRIR
ncbi:MAG: glycosyltransferase family 29 protein [Devosia sp.]|nr:glycosyltransferase family 29 protein [Devosia sp.]MBN9316929.1 glycosyltransferase family 29 protein [Devosia sp.]